ncbi:hypothetical protein M2444_003813 [Paenibacillus sp. PastF-3]|nr:hypothetical protein [Paenibacillus sp. PastF-3]
MEGTEGGMLSSGVCVGGVVEKLRNAASNTKEQLHG